ncbi:UNVERIFIED_CONTAM: hypothetical protein GTU68_029170 [Idotea baltica]|nr:hypothetical protein [Idotea baltica]
MEIKEEFIAATRKIKDLTKRPSNEELLKLYALFKQGSKGDVSGSKPGMFDIKGQAKYKAWQKVKGTSQEDAQKQYLSLVDTMLEKYS